MRLANRKLPDVRLARACGHFGTEASIGWQKLSALKHDTRKHIHVRSSCTQPCK